MHVVFVGLNYQPFRSTGDKNFWAELIHFLAKKLKRITVLSIRESAEKYEESSEGNCRIKVHYLPPLFLETPDPGPGAERALRHHGAFPRWLGIMEKILGMNRICGFLKKLHAEDPFARVHLMDNFGLGNRMVAKNSSAAVSVSAMAYQSRGKFLYDRYLSACYNCRNLTVVPYSLGYFNKLLKIGIGKDRVVRIPWGVRADNTVGLSGEKERKKRILGIPENKFLVLWAGYIQQLQKEDFLFAVKAAREAADRGLERVFYFAFKPESYEKEFEAFHDPGKGIYVRPTTVSEFRMLEGCAGLLYSPITGKNCIIAPPLTWVESLNSGVPVLTTDVPGSEEIITDGKTGYMCGSREDLIEKLFLAEEHYRGMSPDCRKKAGGSYNLESIAEQYLDMWSSAGGKGEIDGL